MNDFEKKELNEELNHEDKHGECVMCESGMVEAITLTVKGRVYLYDFRNRETQKNFIMRNKERIYIQREMFPCNCANGDKLNTKNDKEWIPQSQRLLIIARSRRAKLQNESDFFIERYLKLIDFIRPLEKNDGQFTKILEKLN